MTFDLGLEGCIGVHHIDKEECPKENSSKTLTLKESISKEGQVFDLEGNG